MFDLGDSWLTETAEIEGIRGCSGEWVLIAYRIRPDHAPASRQEPRPTRGIAWFRGVCGNAETTCDMASVDSGN